MPRASIAILLLFCTLAGLAGGRTLAADPSAAPPVPSEPSPFPAPPAASVEVSDPSSLIGLGLSEAAARFGTPAEVFALRGEEAWQDDVVFFYPPGLYLFWYRNAVWQVRLDLHYGGEVLQLRMGAARERVRELLGQPWREEEDALVYQLEDQGYPIRLRLYFENDLLVDLYCYRGDL